jgi:hypothetical protein
MEVPLGSSHLPPSCYLTTIGFIESLGALQWGPQTAIFFSSEIPPSTTCSFAPITPVSKFMWFLSRCKTNRDPNLCSMSPTRGKARKGSLPCVHSLSYTCGSSLLLDNLTGGCAPLNT